jgi:predicted AlkP superfamily pyrophosphatase or phosphodiesterase
VNLFARHWSVVVLACAVLFAACKDQPAPPSPAVAGTGQPVSPSPKTDPVRPAHIILVSFDGTRPDTAQTAAMPTFQAMAREGAVSWSARSIVPPLTLPAHTSMLTGLGPEEHGVFWNEWIPAFGTLRVPTVLSLATSNGLLTAAFSGKDKLAYLFPTGSVSHLSYPMPNPADYYRTNHLQGARQVAALAAAHFIAKRPRLMFVHFLDADLAGHFNGWPSPEYVAALAECDAALAALRAGIERSGVTNTLFLLTADHGGAGLSHGVDRPEDMTIPWIAWGAGVRRGHALTNEITMPDTAATIAWLLDLKLPTNTIGRPVRVAFEQDGR